MKRILSLLLAALLLASLSGCLYDGPPAPGVEAEAGAFYNLAPDDLVAEALRRFDALKSWSWRYTTQADCECFDIDQDVWNGTGETDKSGNLLMHGSLVCWQGMEPQEFYNQVSDGTITWANYQHSTRTGDPAWAYGCKAADGETPEGSLPSPRWGYGLCAAHRTGMGYLLNVYDNIGRLLTAGTDFRRGEKETVNGRSAVCFTGTVSGEALVFILGHAARIWIDAKEEDAPVQQGVPIRIWIDSQDVVPLRIEMDFTDFVRQEAELKKESIVRSAAMKPNFTMDVDEALAAWDETVHIDCVKLTVEIDPTPVTINVPDEIAQGMADALAYVKP